MASEPRKRLEALVADELDTPVRASVSALADEIRRRHGDAVAAVLFYGSCLRNETDEGVLDFYVLVDDYASTVYPRRWHAWINGIAPPNVFYLEFEWAADADATPTTLRTKYAVLSAAAFAHATSSRCLHPYIWARFTQPARLVYARDDDARARTQASVAEATITAIGRLSAFLPAKGSRLRFSVAALWQTAFRRTYDAERRPESDTTIRSIFERDPERYAAVTGPALDCLAERGEIDSVERRSGAYEVECAPDRLFWRRFRWHVLRPLARSIALVRLLKTAFTFGDWVPYVLWKLERHTGRTIDLTPRQRRHPLIFAWPVILPLLARRNLR